MKKICTACGQEKELHEFEKSKSGKHGVTAECKRCLCLRSYARRRKRLEQQGKRLTKIPTLLARENRKNGVKYCPGCDQTKALEEFYTSGKSNKGHASHCKECRKQLCQRYRKLHPEKGKRHYKKYKHRQKSLSLQKRFGLTLEQYEKRLHEQQFKCAICGKLENENGKRLAVDHNHTTMQVRELLCANCNVTIGMAKEDISRLEKIITYLKKWR